MSHITDTACIPSLFRNSHKGRCETFSLFAQENPDIPRGVLHRGEAPRREVQGEKARVTHFFVNIVQGDHSCCSQPPVDIKTKALFEYEVHVLI